MGRLLSDSAAVETMGRALDLMRACCIGDWQSEARQQHQNPAERRWQTAKRRANTIVDRSGSPACAWSLALTCVCLVFNHTTCSARTRSIATPVVQTPALLKWVPIPTEAKRVSFALSVSEMVNSLRGLSFVRGN